MFKKLLKIIGSFFLVLIIIFIGIGIWFGVSASKHNEIAKPYLQKNMPIFTTWDINKIKPLLTPEALQTFESKKGEKILKFFSKLGKLKSFEEPQFLTAKSGASIGTGSYDIVKFKMLGHFEVEDAIFTITLTTDEDSYLIHYVSINSDAFFD